MKGSVVPLLARLLSDHFPHFASRSAITAPAVLAGLGIAVHQTTPWADPMNALGAEDLYRLLADNQWDRQPRYWDGVAAKASATGRLNFGGGVRDSGGRVADVILYPGTEAGRRIRGQ